jgi:CRP-like cAMP-binding protein
MMDFQSFLAQSGEMVTLQPGEHVFQQGDADRFLYFVRSGLLKAYYITREGKEAVKSFIQPGDFIGSLTSAYKRERCSFNLVCLQPTSLLRVEFDALERHSQQHLVIASHVIDFLLNFSMKKERREMEFLSLSAEERYRLLLERSPELLEQVRQKDIARYLGITPVALSRIRGRVGRSK